jgi:hypothetical protein
MSLHPFTLARGSKNRVTSVSWSFRMSEKGRFFLLCLFI